MTEKFRFAALLIVETSDPRLSEDTLAQAIETAGGVAGARRALLQHLPKDVARVVAIMPEAEAWQLCRLHEMIGMDLAEKLGIDPETVRFRRPPSDYVPPTRE
jgi:hypothetical protein